MVKFPSNFVQLDRFPGYYWNVAEGHLYSIKVSGILTKLSLKKAYKGLITGRGYVDIPEGYAISVGGYRRFLSVDYIAKQVAAIEKDQTVPVRTVDK